MSKKLTDDAQLQKEAEKLYPFGGRNPNVTLINGRREGYIEGRKHSVAPVSDGEDKRKGIGEKEVNDFMIQDYKERGSDQFQPDPAFDNSYTGQIARLKAEKEELKKALTELGEDHTKICLELVNAKNQLDNSVTPVKVEGGWSSYQKHIEYLKAVCKSYNKEGSEMLRHIEELEKRLVAPVLSPEQIKEEADKAMNYLITECASSERSALINMMRDMRDDYLENITAHPKQHTEKSDI